MVLEWIIIKIINWLFSVTKDTYTKDVHGKISDSASEGQIISAFLNNSIDI